MGGVWGLNTVIFQILALDYVIVKTGKKDKVAF